MLVLRHAYWTSLRSVYAAEGRTHRTSVVMYIQCADNPVLHYQNMLWRHDWKNARKYDRSKN
jgi:hypothetical protein